MPKFSDALLALKKELAPANQLMEKIAHSEPHITPVTLSDKSLFEEFFSRDPEHTYGNSWIYVTQGVFGIGENNLGYKYYDGKNLCMLSAYPKIENPEIIMMYWVRPMGENILDIIQEYTQRIKEKYHISSYIKKLSKTQYDMLIANGYKSAKEFPWHSSAHSEDDTYPEIIYDRETTLKAVEEASRSSSLGRVKRGIAKVRRENELEISNLNFQDDGWCVVNEYFSERSDLPDKINVSTPFDYCNMIFHNHDPNVDKKILLANKKPVGLYVVEHKKNIDTTNIYCCFALRQYCRYLMDFLKLNIFEDTHAKYVNSGGSEDKGMHYFKKKYQPIAQNTMYTATNYDTASAANYDEAAACA